VKKRSFLLCGLSLLVFSATTAHGGVVTYVDRTAWLAAVQNAQNITFEGIAAAAQAADFSTSAGLTIAGVQFTGAKGDGSTFEMAVVDPAFNPAVYDWLSGAVLRGSHSVTFGIAIALGAIRMDLPQGTTAAGFDYMDVSGVPDNATFLFSTGDRFTGNTATKPTRAFFGFVSTAPIAWLAVGDNTQPMIDNFAFHAVPEPALLGLVAGALVAGLVKLRRRDCSQSTTSRRYEDVASRKARS
jgi:hypothetical protein